MSLSVDLDNALHRAEVHQHRHELKRLANMFSKKSLREMRKAFNKTDTSGYSDYQIAFGWIDKRPYADLAGLSSRVELGDLAIIALNKVVCPGRPARDFTGRCALMQAKLQDVGVSNNLTVLFGKNDASSTNQQYLLSNWGQFELFRHSTGGLEIGSFSLAAQDDSYGWFMAAHRDSVHAGQQRAAWLCGPPGNGATCEVSIGEVIASVASFGSQVGVGARCALTPQLQGKSSDWDNLVALLINECVCEELPEVVQAVAGRGSRLAGILQMMPVGRPGEALDSFDWELPSELRGRRHTEDLLMSRSGGQHMSDEEDRMGVLVINRTVSDKY
ncbi:hypothetical protein VDG44_16935 [Xanthomonas campestris pv. raphani]|uniref:hypothetical protein n=1 Tax=Xanthomonas campestris TaxID=339 RepID=UPI002B2284CA|nr:hypothetical protein [Xanthomonas campestris]MEA9906205.1 hypothetical protein [Xanthomonas campestris pv. raphani]